MLQQEGKKDFNNIILFHRCFGTGIWNERQKRLSIPGENVSPLKETIESWHFIDAENIIHHPAFHWMKDSRVYPTIFSNPTNLWTLPSSRTTFWHANFDDSECCLVNRWESWSLVRHFSKLLSARCITSTELSPSEHFEIHQRRRQRLTSGDAEVLCELTNAPKSFARGINLSFPACDVHSWDRVDGNHFGQRQNRQKMPLRTSKHPSLQGFAIKSLLRLKKKPGNFFSLKSWRINRGAFLRAHWLTSVYQLSAISCIPHFGESLGRAYAARLNCSLHDEALHLVSEQAHDEANSLSLRYQLSNKKHQPYQHSYHIPNQLEKLLDKN